jgi:hypothetical protein
MSRSLNILLIDDNAIEVMKFNRVLSTMNVKHKNSGGKQWREALAIF